MEYPPHSAQRDAGHSKTPPSKQNDQLVIILIVDRPVVNITRGLEVLFACGSTVRDKKKNKDPWQAQKVVQSAHRHLR
jgi:hypothetical protein